MFSAKVILLVGAVMLFGLSGSVAQTTVGKESVASKEIVTEAATVAATELSTERFNASRVLGAIRAEIERRRSERREKTLQRAQERREQILQTLDSLSDRRQEYELRRQDAETLREARRQDMEARRVGRLPQRERERVNRARLEQLAEQTTPEENEIEDTIEAVGGGSEEGSDVVQRVRNLLLIEEADGNLRLIDLDTEEGQQFVLNGGAKRGQIVEKVAEKEKEGEEGDQEQEGGEDASKLKLKTGQI